MYFRVTCIPPQVAGAQEQPKGHWRAGKYWQAGAQYVELTTAEVETLRRFPKNFLLDEVSQSDFERNVVAPVETPEDKANRLEQSLGELQEKFAALSPSTGGIPQSDELKRAGEAYNQSEAENERLRRALREREEDRERLIQQHEQKLAEANAKHAKGKKDESK